jgi:hypothetical protein
MRLPPEAIVAVGCDGICRSRELLPHPDIDLARMIGQPRRVSVSIGTMRASARKGEAMVAW